MKQNNSDTERAFVYSNRAYYAGMLNLTEDEIYFGLYSVEGGHIAGEMSMNWVKLNDRPYPQLRVFDDAWATLATFGDVIAALGKRDSDDITPDEFIAILTACGFSDWTEYEAREAKTE